MNYTDIEILGDRYEEEQALLDLIHTEIVKN